MAALVPAKSANTSPPRIVTAHASVSGRVETLDLDSVSIGAVRDQCDLFADRALGLVEDRVGQRVDRRQAVLVHELVQHARADGRAGDSWPAGRRASARARGRWCGSSSRSASSSVPPSASLQMRQAQAFLVDLACRGREARAADVGQVRDAHRVADDPAVAEHRLHHVDVEQVAGADPGVVGHDRRRRAAAYPAGKRASIAASVAGAVPVNDGTL